VDVGIFSSHTFFGPASRLVFLTAQAEGRKSRVIGPLTASIYLFVDNIHAKHAECIELLNSAGATILVEGALGHSTENTKTITNTNIFLLVLFF
jgi:hypothetical protein